MGPSPHLWFYAFTTATLWPELIVSMGPRPHLSFWACKTTWLTSQLPVSMCPSPYLWFFHAKQRLLDQNYKSLWVPALICGFCMQYSDFSTRIASLYGYQPSSVVLCIHNSDFMTRINSVYGSQTSPVVLITQNNVINIMSMGPSLHLWILHAKQRLLDQNYKSLWVPALICGFWMQNSDFWIRLTSLYWSQPSSVVFESKTATLRPELQVSMGPRPHL